MKFILLLTTFLITFLPAEELRVKAEQFSTDEAAGLTVFTGEVNIIKGSDEINASKIVIYTNQKREPIKFIANGNVSFYIKAVSKTGDISTYKGVSQKVIYLPLKKEYQFFRNVHLEQVDDKKVIIGEEVVLKTLEGKAYAKGANKESVIMIFNMPQDKEKK